MVQHSLDHLDDSPIHSFRDSVLLRRVQDSDLVLDAVFSEVGLEVSSSVFAAVVGLEDLDLASFRQ
jgi:hypothetical protein